MPKKIRMTSNSLESTIMAKVASGEITMKPRWYFVIGSLLMGSGLVGLSIGLVYAFNLTFFLFRSHGPMGEWRLQQLLASFPWWVPVLAGGSSLVGIWLLKKYDFSYRKNFWGVVLGLLLVFAVTAYVLDVSGLSDQWFKRGGMRRIQREQLQQDESPKLFRNQDKNGRMMQM